MKRDCRDVINSFALASLAVQGFDVAESMREAQAWHPDFVRRQSVEHEGIVGIGTMSNRDFAHVARGVGDVGNWCTYIAHPGFSTLRTRRQPDEIPADSITLMISDNINQ